MLNAVALGNNTFSRSWRSHRRHGLVLGFGGVTDDELARCLDVMRSALA